MQLSFGMKKGYARRETIEVGLYMCKIIIKCKFYLIILCLCTGMCSLDFSTVALEVKLSQNLALCEMTSVKFQISWTPNLTCLQ